MTITPQNNTSGAPVPGNSRLRNLIDSVAAGTPLRQALSEAGLTPSAFNHALQGDRELAVAYVRATEIRADLLADEIITIADCENTDPARARNQINARQWLAGKLHSKRYGDRIDVNVTQTLDIGSTLAEARSRLLPVRDQSQTIDAEYSVIPPENAPKPSDK